MNEVKIDAMMDNHARKANILEALNRPSVAAAVDSRWSPDHAPLGIEVHERRTERKNVYPTIISQGH